MSALAAGASREAETAAQAELERVLATAGTDARGLADELFAVSGLLGREITLRRTLADPARTPDSRSEMVRGLLTGKVSPAAVEVVTAVVRQRWSAPSHLAHALDDLAVRSVVASAASDGALDRVEDELFRFRRVLAAEPGLRSALADGTVAAEHRAALVDDLVGTKVATQTKQLLDQAVRDRRGRTTEHTLERYSGLVAATRERLVAHVRTAVDLDGAQRERLGAALARIYGREVALNVELDADVLGGLSVRIGDEIVDSTIAARLDEARRRLAG